MALSTEIQIYVADLAAYNSAKLHGTWIDATQDIDDIEAEIQEMLKASPVSNAEEYAIHEYEGFGSYKLAEHEGIENVQAIALFIEEFPDFGPELLNYYEVEGARRMVEDNYQGCHNSLADYAEQYTEDSGTEIPESLKFYIDYEKMANDWDMSGDIFVITLAHDEIHVFLNN